MVQSITLRQIALTLLIASPLPAIAQDSHETDSHDTDSHETESHAKSSLTEVFATSNLTPLVQTQGIPTTSSATLSKADTWNWQLQTEFANHFTESDEGAEAILLDGETHKAVMTLRYGLSAKWELGIEVPFVRHTGGSLDSFIENWHDTFGLPNGGREDVKTDQLTFSHQLGTTVSTLGNSASSLGDVRLMAGYLLSSDDSSRWALRGGVKLPTGDANDLTGSEAGALFVSIHHDNEDLIRHPDWTFRGSLGVTYLADGDILENQQENWVIYGSAMLAWQLSERLALKAQLDMHSAAYDSRLRELGETAAQLIVGGSLSVTEKLQLDISVSEDIITDTSPDVVLQIGLRKSF